MPTVVALLATFKKKEKKLKSTILAQTAIQTAVEDLKTHIFVRSCVFVHAAFRRKYRPDSRTRSVAAVAVH